MEQRRPVLPLWPLPPQPQEKVPVFNALFCGKKLKLCIKYSVKISSIAEYLHLVTGGAMLNGRLASSGKQTGAVRNSSHNAKWGSAESNAMTYFRSYQGITDHEKITPWIQSESLAFIFVLP